jgi:glutamate formiminotransferase / formiminotetrahydrofolate cyclodeaminase
MARSIVECVPNFSEGRNLRTVEAIVESIGGTPGVAVLGYDADPDHNRSVVTFAGGPQAVSAAALRGIAKAVELIDLSRHEGVHPRIGAADVVPLVPVEGVTLEECARLAHELGAEVWRLLRVPVYFYEAAARVEERRRLENVRRGGYAWLRDHVAERPPDIGGAALHATAGAVVIGARKFLVAFNVNLATSDVEIARSIARSVRESSGGLPAVKALGLPIESRGRAQVSMNLTDFERVGIGHAFEAVRAEAMRRGVEIASSEMVGLAPRRAVREAASTLLRCENLSAERVLEDRMEALAPGRQFDEVLERISNPASPMGGGSAAALTGALAAALGCMVARLSKLDSSPFEEHREYFAQAAERDAEAFREVSMARKAEESGRTAALQAAYRRAAAVPAGMTARAKELDRDLLRLKEAAPAKLQPDLTTALGLARACRAGGIAAARANLPFIEDPEFRKVIEEQLDRRPPD